MIQGVVGWLPCSETQEGKNKEDIKFMILMAFEFLVNIGSGNGLLLDSTKPLPEPMLINNR